MKELILLGRGPSWRSCPFNAETWATATVYLVPNLCDKHFDKVFTFDPMYEDLAYCLGTARERGIPVVSWFDYATEKYPLDEVVKKFKTNYLVNTASYMIALALYKGYEKLRIYGIDQCVSWQYIQGKAVVEYWVGMARGIAIGEGRDPSKAVEIAPNSSLGTVIKAEDVDSSNFPTLIPYPVIKAMFEKWR